MATEANLRPLEPCASDKIWSRWRVAASLESTLEPKKMGPAFFAGLCHTCFEGEASVTVENLFVFECRPSRAVLTASFAELWTFACWTRTASEALSHYKACHSLVASQLLDLQGLEPQEGKASCLLVARSLTVLILARLA